MKKLLSTITLAAMTFAAAASGAAAETSVSVNINGYIPAPPGVHVYVESGRPYYRENGRVVYLQRDEGHHKRKHGHAYGHRKDEWKDGGHRHGHGHH